MEETTANLRGSPPVDEAPRYTLTVLSGPATGTTVPLCQPRTTIGRSSSADVTIDDATLSRYHLELELLDGGRGLIVRDLRSKNGTYVRNCRIIEAFIEEHGHIELGEDTLLEVSLPPTRVTGISAHEVAMPADPRLRASTPRRPTPAPISGPTLLRGRPPSGHPEDIPTHTLVIRRHELAALMRRNGS